MTRRKRSYSRDRSFSSEDELSVYTPEERRSISPRYKSPQARPMRALTTAARKAIIRRHMLPCEKCTQQGSRCELPDPQKIVTTCTLCRELHVKCPSGQAWLKPDDVRAYELCLRRGFSDEEADFEVYGDRPGLLGGPLDKTKHYHQVASSAQPASRANLEHYFPLKREESEPAASSEVSTGSVLPSSGPGSPARSRVLRTTRSHVSGGLEVVLPSEHRSSSGSDRSTLPRDETGLRAQIRHLLNDYVIGIDRAYGNGDAADLLRRDTIQRLWALYGQSGNVPTEQDIVRLTDLIDY